MDKRKTNPVIMTVGAVVVLVGALGVGMGVRHFRATQAGTQEAEQDGQAAAEQSVVGAESGPISAGELTTLLMRRS